MNSSNRLLIDLAIRCYPRAWRAERAEEPYVLADDLLFDGVSAFSIAYSFFRGAFDARTTQLSTNRTERARQSLGSIVGAWAVFIPAAILTIWLIDQPGGRSFPVYQARAVILNPARLHFLGRGFGNSVILASAGTVTTCTVFWVMSFVPVVVGALRRASVRSAIVLIRALGPGACAFGVVVVWVALFSQHAYSWIPSHEAHLPGTAPESVPFQFGWNLGFSGLFLFATPGQIPNGLHLNMFLLTLITLSEVVAILLVARGVRSVFVQAVRSSRVLRFEIVTTAIATVAMALMWCSLVAWILWEYLSPAVSARFTEFTERSSSYFSGFVFLPLLFMAASLIVALRRTHRSISAWPASAGIEETTASS